MDENTNNAIFIIMQKVVDKLKNLSEAIDKKDNTELKEAILKDNGDIKELLAQTINNQLKLKQINLEIGTKLFDTIQKEKTVPIVNNYSEYSLLGSKSHFKPLTLIIMLFSLVIIWSSFKYIPPYLTEESSLKKEKEEYMFFYNYMYLKEFNYEGKTTANETLKKYRQNDTVLINEYYSLLTNYNNKTRKQELEEELKSLEKNGR